ncbi:MAG: ribonuclease H-like domain-containing protein [Candidatus Aenigmarchaeota archaeon]|nr:ribonuclease H-like domain-containing protein [Candidatus Aenigmarchaeota archaeon]MDW8148992.1 ribonuclease H-like domain-containing protein [Candidatus Aenigmarchaeota archaeon]
MKEYVFDIETTSLDADVGSVIAIGLKEVNGNEEILFDTNEINVIKDFLSKIDNTITLIGFNIKKFDIPFLNFRCFVHKIKCSQLKKVKTIDVLEIVKESFRTSNLKLIMFKKIFGIIDEVESSNIETIYLEYLKTNDDKFKNEIIDHLRKDLIACEEVYKRLKEIGIL